MPCISPSQNAIITTNKRQLIIANTNISEQTLIRVYKSQFENIGCCLKGQHPNPFADRFATYRRIGMSIDYFPLSRKPMPLQSPS